MKYIKLFENFEWEELIKNPNKPFGSIGIYSNEVLH
jgi:hypothetical protein